MQGVREVPGTRFSPLRHVHETGSTNADLLAAAQTGAREGAVLVTDHQTAGRGRQGRSFHDEPGSAALFSILLRPEPDIAGLVPLFMGLAAVDAAHTVIGLDPDTTDPVVRLKWPNDLIVPGLGERKLAGILAEATTGADGRLAVVVGMGMNLRWVEPPPPDIVARAATLEEAAQQAGVAEPVTDRARLVTAVLVALEGWLGRAENGRVGDVLDAYRARCATIGRQVDLDTPSGPLSGLVWTVTDTGALRVETGQGPVDVLAGDAHHR
ncbi:MAG: biotin--[acetyl-CoA-carboxylase] ligase [Acidimicrobiales bacterium]